MRAPFDIAADLDTPVSAYRKLGAFGACFLLESVEGGSRLARYSFIGLDPAFVVRREAPGTGHQAPGGEEGEAGKDDLLGLLRSARDRAPILYPVVPELPLAGGIVGALGYDAVRSFERLPSPPGAHDPEPVALFVAPRSMLVFDHLTRRVALLHAGEEWERVSLRREIIHALRGAHPPEPVRAGHSPAVHSMTRDAFMDRVGIAKGHIREGDVFQLVLSIRSVGEVKTDPFQVYRALRLLNPSSYMYYLDIDGMQVVGSSPEALFRLNGRTASLRPIAGTRARGADEAGDVALERELLADPKEAAEHVMLVDLARNDLGRVARAGSVRVDPYRLIERYSHVMHLVSGVTGTLRDGADAMDLLAASFPAGTLVGTPKVRAMELIDALEPWRRGLYAGTVGYFAREHDGMPANADQAICIRTLTFKDGVYAYQAGAGIVADSVAASEFDEVRNKVGALEAALALAAEGL